MAGALVAERPQNRANDMFASVNFWPAGGVATRRQTSRLADIGYYRCEEPVAWRR